MQTAQQQPIPAPEVDLALDRATQELNTSYMDLCERVERLTQELHQSRTQLVRELAEKEVIFQRLSALVQALDLSGGVVAQAAKLLGLQRTTLVEKMRKQGLERAE